MAPHEVGAAPPGDPTGQGAVPPGIPALWGRPGPVIARPPAAHLSHSTLWSQFESQTWWFPDEAHFHRFPKVFSTTHS
jgi:hypothetical protein